MTNQTLAHSGNINRWEQAIYAFLAEKERRSGSRRTVESYSRMLSHFFGRLGKTTDEVTPTDVFAYAHGKGLSGREPSSVIIGARIACLSAFYKFLIRMELATSNPCDKLQRPRVTPSSPRGLSGEQIRRLLSVIPYTPVGLCDRAIILTLVFTGRRRSEVLNLKAGDLEVGDRVFYSYRGKGGKRGKRELPQPAFEAIRRALAAFGKDLVSMKPADPLWPSSSSDAAGITSGTFYGNLRKYLKAAGLPPSGVHIFRHSAAKLRRDAGESVEQVGQFLDHSSLGVTTVYLRRLEGQHDEGWAKVAEFIGI